ncbi:MAG TPA: flagellar motor protein MotB [Bacilli bacterium]
MSKKHKAPGHDVDHIDETWLIPYADLLTLLLALFIVLFASSSIDAKKYDQIMVSFNEVLSGGSGVLENNTPVGESPPMPKPKDSPTDEEKKEIEKQQELELQKETIDLEKLKKKLDDYIKENNLTSQLETTLNTQQLTITIRDNALFASGSATLKQEARVLGTAISKMLQQYPQYEIEVAGHTDDRPINTFEFDSNWDLSAERASNFMDVLLLNEEIVPRRFRAVAYGEYRPLKTNRTEAGRSENRRVEVSIFRNFQSTPEVIDAN